MSEQSERPGADIRDELLQIVRSISDKDNRPDEATYDVLIQKWNALCPHPGGTDIIFWPNELGLCRENEVGLFEMSPEEMVDFALNWVPRIVAMQIIQRSGGKSVGYYLYKLIAPDTPKTQVVTSIASMYENGAVVAVALKGVRLEDGSVVDTNFDFGAMLCGKILGITNDSIGSRIDR